MAGPVPRAHCGSPRVGMHPGQCLHDLPLPCPRHPGASLDQPVLAAAPLGCCACNRAHAMRGAQPLPWALPRTIPAYHPCWKAKAALKPWQRALSLALLMQYPGQKALAVYLAVLNAEANAPPGAEAIQRPQDMLWSMLPWADQRNHVRMPRREVATAVRLLIFGLGVGIAILVSCVGFLCRLASFACCAACCICLSWLHPAFTCAGMQGFPVGGVSRPTPSWGMS